MVLPLLRTLSHIYFYAFISASTSKHPTHFILPSHTFTVTSLIPSLPTLHLSLSCVAQSLTVTLHIHLTTSPPYSALLTALLSCGVIMRNTSRFATTKHHTSHAPRASGQGLVSAASSSVKNSGSEGGFSNSECDRRVSYDSKRKIKCFKNITLLGTVLSRRMAELTHYTVLLFVLITEGCDFGSIATLKYKINLGTSHHFR